MASNNTLLGSGKGSKDGKIMYSKTHPNGRFVTVEEEIQRMLANGWSENPKDFKEEDK